MGTIIAMTLIGIGVLIALGACIAPLVLPTPHGRSAAIAHSATAVVIANIGVLLSVLAAGSSFWMFWTQCAGYISLFAFVSIATRYAYIAISQALATPTLKSRSSELLHLRPRVS